MRLLAALIVLVATIVLVSSLAFIAVMFNGEPTRGAWVEALNFSIQTVTTVGYGNWDQPRVFSERVPQDWELRIFATKTMSLPVMLFGALIFGMIPSTLVVLLLR